MSSWRDGSLYSNRSLHTMVCTCSRHAEDRRSHRGGERGDRKARCRVRRRSRLAIQSAAASGEQGCVRRGRHPVGSRSMRSPKRFWRIRRVWASISMALAVAWRTPGEHCYPPSAAVGPLITRPSAADSGKTWMLTRMSPAVSMRSWARPATASRIRMY